MVDVEVAPRYTINEYVGITAQYRYLRKSADRYTGTFSLDSAATGFGPVTLNASMLDAGTATTEQRWGLGLTFSTVAAATRHASRIPFDVSYLHYGTFAGTAGAGGLLPRIGYDAVELRLYVRLLGHGGPFRH
jgi:carbohydrate-selective porin OprB